MPKPNKAASPVVERIAITIEDNGSLNFVWDDRLADLAAGCDVTTKRVSNVEPADDGQWWADMAPVDGPKLGPYRLRGEALQAERDWLWEHLGV